MARKADPPNNSCYNPAGRLLWLLATSLPVCSPKCIPFYLCRAAGCRRSCCAAVGARHDRLLCILPPVGIVVITNPSKVIPSVIKV